MTKRRQQNILIAVAATALLAGLVIPALQPAKEFWSGDRILDVNVRVTDAAGEQPISDAQVTVFDHPVSPQEGRLPKLDVRAIDLETYATDADGWCRFKQEFRAGGSRVGSVSNAYVHTSGTWIKVSAPGRKSTFVPLDRQSTGARGPQDKTPLVATVVLDKGSD